MRSSLACWWMQYINHTRQGQFVQLARPNCKARLAVSETCLSVVFTEVAKVSFDVPCNELHRFSAFALDEFQRSWCCYQTTKFELRAGGLRW